MLRLITALAALASAFVVSVTGAGAAAQFPATIPLPTGFQPEGITISGTTFWVGSIRDGSIYRGNLRTGTGSVIARNTGRAAIGTQIAANRLFVAGGGTGKAWVYNARTGAQLAEFTLSPGGSFINDVVVTRRAAYFTDSFRAQLYRVPFVGNGFGTPQTIPLTGAYQHGASFNANGIDATGRWLIIVQSNTGKLFRVNPTTGATTAITTSADLTNGDGILLDGRRLYVVRNQNNQVAVLRLNNRLTSAALVTTITDSRFAVPTTTDDFGRRLYVVNAKFGVPTNDYEIVQVRKPAGR